MVEYGDKNRDQQEYMRKGNKRLEKGRGGELIGEHRGDRVG